MGPVACLPMCRAGRRSGMSLQPRQPRPRENRHVISPLMTLYSTMPSIMTSVRCTSAIYIVSLSISMTFLRQKRTSTGQLSSGVEPTQGVRELSNLFVKKHHSNHTNTSLQVVRMLRACSLATWYSFSHGPLIWLSPRSLRSTHP